MWATRTTWNDGSRSTVLQWVSCEAADTYAARMRKYGYSVLVWKLP